MGEVKVGEGQRDEDGGSEAGSVLIGWQQGSGCGARTHRPQDSDLYLSQGTQSTEPLRCPWALAFKTTRECFRVKHVNIILFTFSGGYMLYMCMYRLQMEGIEKREKTENVLYIKSKIYQRRQKRRQNIFFTLYRSLCY